MDLSCAKDRDSRLLIPQPYRACQDWWRYRQSRLWMIRSVCHHSIQLFYFLQHPGLPWTTLKTKIQNSGNILLQIDCRIQHWCSHSTWSHFVNPSICHFWSAGLPIAMSMSDYEWVIRFKSWAWEDIYAAQWVGRNKWHMMCQTALTQCAVPFHRWSQGLLRWIFWKKVSFHLEITSKRTGAHHTAKQVHLGGKFCLLIVLRLHTIWSVNNLDWLYDEDISTEQTRTEQSRAFMA